MTHQVLTIVTGTAQFSGFGAVALRNVTALSHRYRLPIACSGHSVQLYPVNTAPAAGAGVVLMVEH